MCPYGNRCGGIEENMKKNIIPFIVILVAILMDFYLLPSFIIDTGSGMYLLLIIIPIIDFICSTIFGIIYSFKIYFPFLVAMLFVPAVYIFFNDSAYIYVFGYGIVSFVGTAIGSIGRYAIQGRLNNRSK